MKASKSKLSFTVGLPSYKSGPSILETIKSIRNSKGVNSKFDILVCVDGPTLDLDLEKKILKLNARVIHNDDRLGQTARNKQIAQLVKTDIYIQTQDDVRFAPDTLSKVLMAFEIDPKLTMVSPKFIPLKPRNSFEKAHHFGILLVHNIIEKWNKGDNYLSAVGRFLAFRSVIVKRFEISDKVVNCDAYYYFENQRLDGKYKYLPQAVVYYRTPDNMDEHLKQVRKFVASKNEINHYLGKKYSSQYVQPKSLFVREFISTLIRSPYWGIGYILITIYSRTRPKSFYQHVTRFWEVDSSTKN